MKIVIIGSTQYLNKILKHKEKLETEGHEVLIPAFDDHVEFNELEICEYNRELIKQADRVDIIWDRRSMGTLFDFGQAFALEKPVKIIYLESKTLWGVMKRYEKKSNNQNTV
jgi:nucleoside 2-deoxyribosyltransferase